MSYSRRERASANVFVEPCIHAGSKIMSYAAARRRVSRRGAFAGLRSVCFIRPSSEDLLSVTTMTLDEAQIGPQVCSANLIASISYMLMSNEVSVDWMNGIEKALDMGIMIGLKGPGPSMK